MNDLTIGLLGALLATNQPLAVSNVIQQQTGVAIAVAADPVERELRDVMLADDAAQAEVGGWIQANDALGATTNALPKAVLNERIRARFDGVRHSYEIFLRNHPDSAKGFLAYGSFLNDIGDEENARVQYENSRQLDPKNPAVWNNLANYYGEHGPLKNAFAYYAEAIRLNPDEPVYYRNFATTVYLFRKDAREYYHLTEPQVFDKALALYRQALALTPQDFTLATDYAESYYGIRPLRTNDALAAWTNALNIAHTGLEKEGVEIHLARVKIAAGFYEQASNHLANVTNGAYLDLKRRLYQSLLDHKNPPTNAVADTLTNAVAVASNTVAVLTNTVLAATNLSAVPAPSEIPAPVLRGQKP